MTKEKNFNQSVIKATKDIVVDMHVMEKKRNYDSREKADQNLG